MATQGRAPLSDRMRARGLRAAGLAIILLSAGAVLLPAGKRISSDMIGALLIAAGLIEAVAGSLRRDVRRFAIAAGGVTTLAGLIFVINRETHFFPTVTIVIAWLLIRSVILAVGSFETAGSVRTWTAISAGIDLLLGIMLIAGLSITTIVISIFGPTRWLIASFSWFVAVSFIVNGLLLLEVASCEREGASD